MHGRIDALRVCRRGHHAWEPSLFMRNDWQGGRHHRGERKSRCPHTPWTNMLHPSSLRPFPDRAIHAHRSRLVGGAIRLPLSLSQQARLGTCPCACFCQRRRAACPPPHLTFSAPGRLSSRLRGKHHRCHPRHRCRRQSHQAPAPLRRPHPEECNLGEPPDPPSPSPSSPLIPLMQVRMLRTEVLLRRDMMLCLDEVRAGAGGQVVQQRGAKQVDEALMRHLNRSVEAMTKAMNTFQARNPVTPSHFPLLPGQRQRLKRLGKWPFSNSL